MGVDQETLDSCSDHQARYIVINNNLNLLDSISNIQDQRDFEFIAYKNIPPTMTSTKVETPAAESQEPQYNNVDLVHFEPRHYGDWRDEFHQNGCVVIKNVISSERAEYYRDKQIQWLKNFELGFDENDESTWTAEHLPVSFKGG